MGLSGSRADDAPQHEAPVAPTLKAACAYFSLTASLTSVALMDSLLCRSGDFLRAYSLVAGAAFRIKKRQNLPQRFRVRRIAKKRAFAPHPDQTFVFQLV